MRVSGALRGHRAVCTPLSSSGCPSEPLFQFLSGLPCCCILGSLLPALLGSSAAIVFLFYVIFVDDAPLQFTVSSIRAVTYCFVPSVPLGWCYGGLEITSLTLCFPPLSHGTRGWYTLNQMGTHLVLTRGWSGGELPVLPGWVL